MTESTICPLCSEQNTSFYFKDKFRIYFNCNQCNLVFVPKEYHLDQTTEKSRYDLHENNPDDPGYRKFLSRIFLPMLDIIETGAKGLDFGCGPGPTLSLMFGQEGIEVKNYDIFYANKPELLKEKYDFVTCSEVIEHFNQPLSGWEQLLSLVKKGGYLGIMTSMVPTEKPFNGWRYKDDDTHVSFFSPETFSWLAEKYQLDIAFHGTSVVIFSC